MKAIVIHNFGPPEALEYEDVPDPVPRLGEIRVRVHDPLNVQAIQFRECFDLLICHG